MTAFAIESNSLQSALFNRFLNVIQNPSIIQRCQEVTQLLQEANIKDVQSLFPVLVENIFGFGPRIEWGLKSSLRSSHPREFSALRSFLAPDGPLLRLTYKLLGDGFVRYEFPISCLPAPSRQMLEEGVVPFLYLNKLQYSSHGSVTSAIYLNAFEFYFFHFVYFSLNPVHQRNSASNVNPNEVLYLSLLESYLAYFLPTDSNSIPPISIHPSVISGWQSLSSLLPGSFSNFIGLTPSSNSFGFPVSTHGYGASSALPQRTSSQLLKITPNAVGFSPPHGASSGNLDNFQMEVWRTETLVLILVEFLLNQAINESSQSFSAASSVVRTQQLSPDVFERLFADKFVPSPYHMGIVRIVVKHLHYFANSALNHSATGNIYPCGPQGALEQLKCTIIPQLFQKKLYTFLRLSFDRWPMDASFRMPLETWLSYIQPWRYVSRYLQSQLDIHDREERECTLEAKWHTFITENLLFYSVIFQQLLPRFLRMELASPKNAYMLYRVTKVLSQGNLGEMIRDVESQFQQSSPPSSWSQTSLQKSDLFTPPSLRSVRDQASVGGLYQQIAELEGSGFVYTPLFGKDVQSKVSQLLLQISQAKEVNASQQTVQEKSTGSTGWISAFFSLSGSNYEDEYTIGERKKIETHLDNASQQLCHLFQVSVPSPTSPSIPEQIRLHTPRMSQIFEEAVPAVNWGLTPLQRHRMINGIGKRVVLYPGNPDTQPIRSYEIAFLVRMLYQISVYMSAKYGQEMQALYYRRGFLGSLSRQIFAGPSVYYETLKDGTKARHIPRTSPPRLNLRFLASHQTIGYLLGIFLFAYAWGIGPVTCLFLLCIMFLTLAALKAGTEIVLCREQVTPPRQRPLEQE